MPNDFITTIDSDDESIVDDSPPSLQNKNKKASSKSKSKSKSSKSSKSLRANGSDVENAKGDDGAVDLNPDFVFDLNEDTYAEVLEEQDKLEGLVKGSKHVRGDFSAFLHFADLVYGCWLLMWSGIAIGACVCG